MEKDKDSNFQAESSMESSNIDLESFVMVERNQLKDHENEESNISVEANTSDVMEGTVEEVTKKKAANSDPLSPIETKPSCPDINSIITLEQQEKSSEHQPHVDLKQPDDQSSTIALDQEEKEATTSIPTVFTGNDLIEELKHRRCRTTVQNGFWGGVLGFVLFGPTGAAVLCIGSAVLTTTSMKEKEQSLTIKLSGRLHEPLPSREIQYRDCCY